MDILAICMPIFIIIMIGSILCRLKLIDHTFIDSSNKLVMNIFLPVLLFSKISQSNFNEVFSHIHISIFLAAIVAIFIIGFPLARLLKLPDAASRTFVTNSFRANAAFVGLPVCFYAFGSQGLSYASIYLAFLVPVNNILGIMAYNTGGYKLSEMKEIIKNTFLNPLIIACILGIMFSFVNISLPAYIDRTLSILGGVALPLALLGIGVNINLEHLNGNKRMITITSIMKLLVEPLIAFLLFKLLVIDSFGLIEKVAIILLASPAAQVNYIFASAMEGDPELASGGIVFSTLLSALTFAFWISIM